MATKGVSKDVKYLNKDFSAFRDGLIEFAKSRYDVHRNGIICW